MFQAYLQAQALPYNDYKELSANVHRADEEFAQRLTRDIERKIKVYKKKCEKENATSQACTPAITIVPCRKRAHKKSKRMAKREYDKRKRHRKQEKKKISVKKEVEDIKNSNLVRNFSEEDVPDEAYLYLALGSTFCPKKPQNMHDFVFDTKEFCRKLAWRTYFQDQRKQAEDSSEDEFPQSPTPGSPQFEVSESIDGWTSAPKLKVKSRKNPDYNDRLLNNITEKLNDVSNITMPSKQQKSMTHLEAAGQRWCQNAVKKRKIYITKVDKGGCILILCAEKVHEIMIETLNEEEMFQELKEDPRDYIKKLIKDTICEYGESGLLSPRDVFSICGVTEKGGMSHGHEFAVRKPYMYPLFKLH